MSGSDQRENLWFWLSTWTIRDWMARVSTVHGSVRDSDSSEARRTQHRTNSQSTGDYAMASSSPLEWDQLLAASQRNLPDTIRTLISEGVDPNHANRVGQSAVHIAAIWGHGAYY